MKAQNLNPTVNFSLPKTVNAKNVRVSIVKSLPIYQKCSNVLTVSAHKKVLAEKNVVLTVPALNNVLRTVRATLIVKSVIKNIILPFVQKSCHY